jgi:starvation-inducible outer membrane lipoprotein
MNTRHALAAIAAAAAFALAACTSTPDTSGDNPATTTVIETTSADSEDMTQTVVDLSWAQQTETDKNAMCGGIAMFGTEWAAEQMRIGAGNESVDWDRAAVLVEAKCAQR